METENLKRVEAILFASGRFLEVTRMAEVLETAPSSIREICEQLQKKYDANESALQILNEEDAYKLHVRDSYLEIVSKIVADTEISGPVMETLAIIAWRSPALQSEIIEVRGTNAYDHIKELLERGFVVREPEGRSYRLRITEKFFEYFDVEGRDDIKEVFKDVEEAHRKKEMELELQHKRVEKQREEAEQEEQIPETLPNKKLDIDDLDAVLEKSRKARETMAGDLEKEKKKSEENEASEDEELQEAKRIREKVEVDIEELEKK